MKSQNNFWSQNAFLTHSWRFLRSNKLERLEFKLEKILGVRNMQEKLENSIFLSILLDVNNNIDTFSKVKGRQF